MSTITQLELVNDGPQQAAEPGNGPDLEALRLNAAELAHRLDWLPNVCTSGFLIRCWTALERKLTPVLRCLNEWRPTTNTSEDFRSLRDNLNLVSSGLESTRDACSPKQKLPHVRTMRGDVVPRVLVIAESLLMASDYQFTEPAFTAYLEAFQQCMPLDMKELWVLISTIKLVLLGQVAVRGARLLENQEGSYETAVCIRSLRDIEQTPWREVIEPLILFDRVLRQDPVGIYSQMDFDSRELYRAELVNIAEHSDFSEQDVALAALCLARQAQQDVWVDPRERTRYAHIGYYLVSDGAGFLQEKVGFHPPLGQRLRSFLKQHPDEFYLPGIVGLTFTIMSAIILLLTAANSPPLLILVTMLALLLPCSQSAVQVINYLVTSLLKPQILPKIDYSSGIAEGCVTLVAVPTLLLSEDQVRRLVDELEVRFLGNHDRNLHFTLLTDLADSPVLPSEDDPLVTLCASLIQGLNEKYAGRGMGSFSMLHRHRIYNPRDRVWMGWERKRGKLLELNQLLRQQHDSFPVKVGNLSILPRVRFVITLDGDTELPRGSAQRMIGALAHPLNQAILDHEDNIVVAGYGILQPRVGVSVQSAARSRLAKIYSGQTGLDIYTCAVSDVYQDLYGAASFAGKGIYEVDVLLQTLDGRFPTNALLSHDLIEGAYACAGLVSDIQIIEDYPSHYSAYNRRKHRWLRGDWQIAEWVGSRVPGQNGERVRNPIRLISQWKILDNLRRSLVEPATFLLLVLGWLVLPGRPRDWTLATIAILFLPAWCRSFFDLVRAVMERKIGIVRDALAGLFAASVNVFLMLTFLAHQMLLSFDAMIRTLVRRLVTRRRLLQWETAAEAELAGHQRTPLDVYLDWTPALAVGLGLLLLVARRGAFTAGLPILILWACSKLVSVWLNLPPRAPRTELAEKDKIFLRKTALRTWRYFAEFSTAEHNWLIPDNVVEGNPLKIAARISPTNLGLLLNARQVASRFGFLTAPEFVELTQRTLEVYAQLPRYRGHPFNWYDTRTLEPLTPRFVSSVDSGNLAASLWTLAQGCLEQLRLPMLQPAVVDGLIDHLRILMERHAISRRAFARARRTLNASDWLRGAMDLPDAVLEEICAAASAPEYNDVRWFAGQAQWRLIHIKHAVRSYTPWLLPEFDSLRDADVLWQSGEVALDRLPEFIDRLAAHLRDSADRNASEMQRALAGRLLERLADARATTQRLIKNLQQIVANAERLANEMDFKFLVHPQRKLLSVGFDVESRRLQAACYDLLASESRTALFVAIAKDDVPQQSWFQLARPLTLDQGRPILRSWTGTMFEYLMPSIWIRTYPGTLLERSLSGAVRVQRAYSATRHIPWGISECACAKKDDAGNYGYFAFGLARLAVQKGELNALVISPYSTLLALPVDPAEALRNLRRMSELGWVGPYGFYESADFRLRRRFWGRRYQLVRCWMAHHQGMSLLAIANFLCDGMVQRWFHREPRVQATELLLQEKPVAYVRPPHERYGTSAA
jgi:cyclic beta-1,2-glucan synthetase